MNTMNNVITVIAVWYNDGDKVEYASRADACQGILEHHACGDGVEDVYEYNPLTDEVHQELGCNWSVALEEI
jgi:hypothetical protein